MPAGGVVPRDGEGDAVLACRGGVGVGGLRRGGGGVAGFGRGGVGVAGFGCGGDRLGCAGGLGSEGWGGGGGCGCVGASRVGCAGVDGCRGAALYGICCRVCVGGVLGLACGAVRGVGLHLLLGRCLGLHRVRYGRHGHRRADHGRARDRAKQVVKGSFHSGASR